MNPAYSSQYIPQHYSQQSPQNPAAPHPPYYPIHYPHPHHYSPYQYPSVVMYPSQRPSPTGDIPHVSHVTPLPCLAASKRKRKSTERSDDETAPPGSDIPLSPSSLPTPTPVLPASNQTAPELKKRTKTQRACDSCRSRKIRCDVLSDIEPPICQHCKQYGFECTFHLPITETRFKKKKLDEDSADKDSARPITPPKSEGQQSIIASSSQVHHSHISRSYESDELRFYQSFHIAVSDDGLISIRNSIPEESQKAYRAAPLDYSIDFAVIEKLVNSYFTDVSAILPLLTKADFLANPKPPPILLYSICLVASIRRPVPLAVFDSIRFIVNSIIKAHDVLSTPTIANVQALLILCMAGDCHSHFFVPDALSAVWVRLGTAIRMAQDLDLHRAESSKKDIELRRRLWAACLVCDRWTSLLYGHPYMIDIEDCNARLPSGDPSDLYMDELVRISVVLGRVLKTIYGPSGLAFATDEILYTVLADIEIWKSNLPDHLKFRGPETPLTAGLLHLLYSCVCMMFWRVFMRIGYSRSAHLKFGLTPDKWTPLVQLTEEAIDWLDAHEHVYDVWLLVAYAAVSCALVQYHTWARGKEGEAMIKLRKLRDTVRRWEASVSPDRISARRKSAEIISLLYQATQSPRLLLASSTLNSDGDNDREGVVGLNHEKDPTRSTPALTSSTFSGSPLKIISESNSQKSLASRMMSNVICSGGTESTTVNAFGCAQLTSLENGISDGSLLEGSMNINPSMNLEGHAPSQVDVLDGQQTGKISQDFSLEDIGGLECVPRGMFDWGQWDNFFSHITDSTRVVDAKCKGRSQYLE